MSEIAQIDCGFLATVQAFADEHWEDPIQKKDLEADVESARAVVENQRVKFQILQSPAKDRTVSLEWLTTCDRGTTDCSDDCSIDGDDATPTCKEYELTCLQESDGFKINDRVYRARTIDTARSLAVQLENAKMNLDNWVAQYILAQILANAGTNAYTGAPGTVAAAVTTIPAASWNDQIWGYFARVILGNKFKNTYAISGDNLFQLVYNRKADFANADGKGFMNRMGQLRDRLYFDPINIEDNLVAPGYTFLLHHTAVAFVTKAYYPKGAANRQVLTADRVAWSEASRNIPGVEYDVFAERGCYDNDYYTAYKVQLHGGFFLNPQPCDDTNSGILGFECV